MAADLTPLVAIAGNPNAGKSALFNALTGARQRIGNYPGVTVERKMGRLALADGRPVHLLDLPGSYSLNAGSLDEQVTRDVLTGSGYEQRAPDVILAVVDAGNLANHLRFVLELKALGRPMVVALNMVDMAERDGLQLAPELLAQELGVPVIATVAVRGRGLDELRAAIDDALQAPAAAPASDDVLIPGEAVPGVDGNDAAEAERKQRAEIARIMAAKTITGETPVRQTTQMLDRVLLHPVGGVLILFGLLFFIFQAVFAWSDAPIGWIEGAFEWLAGMAANLLPDGFLQSLVIDGIIAGVGAVVVFLPQILILFTFILLLEASGYMTRAAFVMDRMMAGVGLSGHSFIPLLSSFACAIPGIMATRSIMDEKDRLTTILIAPLMTCSARLPVYTVIIGAFIPAQSVGPGIGLEGLVLFGLYLAGIVGAMAAAFFIRKGVTKGGAGSFLIEMPRFQIPRVRDILIGLWQRAWIFLRRAGTIIFAATVILWLLLSFPKVPIGSDMSQAEYSAAGRIASGIAPAVKPIGFNDDIALAIIPAMAAREVAVSALATANAIDESGDEDAVARSLGDTLASKWSLATALAFLAWFVFAPQCISTIAVAKRETNSWKWPIFMTVYLFVLAYAAAGITYWTAVAFGLG